MFPHSLRYASLARPINVRQVVNKELLEVHQTQLMEKESTGLCALLQDYKKPGVASPSNSCAILMQFICRTIQTL